MTIPDFKSFKVGVKTADDEEWCYNALRFPNHEAAAVYGEDLARRWTLVTEWAVHPSDEEPNR